jgi:OOP family OmpA-OmpF porin
MAALFDKLIQEISSQYHLGAKGRSVIEQTLDMIVEQPGDVGGFLDRFKAAGFVTEVASWLEGKEPVSLSAQAVVQALGSDIVGDIANKAGVSQRLAKTVLSYAIPKIISRLAQSGLLDVALATTSSQEDEPPQQEETQLPAREREDVGTDRWYRKVMGRAAPGPTYSQVVFPIAFLFITIGLLGYLVTTGGTRYPASQSAPAVAKNAPVAATATPPVVINRRPTQTSPAAVETAPAAVPHALSTPARLVLSNENGVLLYSGTVRDSATRTAITESLKTVFGDDKISGKLSVDEHAGQARWIKDLNAALDDFKTPGAQAQFEGNTISVGGTIPRADRDKIIYSLKSTLGPEFAIAPLAGIGMTKTASETSLKSGVSDKPVTIPEQSSLKLPTIYFATNSTEVTSISRDELERAAVQIKKLPVGTLVRISGFTDSTGNSRANMNLSQRRAYAVRKVLVDAGVNPAMLSARGYGIYHSAVSKNRTLRGRSSGTIQDYLHTERCVELRVAQL